MRLYLAAPATFIGYDGQLKATLLDISQTGAKLAFVKPPSGPAGFIRWMDFETFGELVWRKGLFAGFQFDQPIPLSWLVQTRHRADHVDKEEHARVLKAARAWVGT